MLSFDGHLLGTSNCPAVLITDITNGAQGIGVRVMQPNGNIINQNLNPPVKINVLESGDLALLLKAEIIRIE